MMLGYYDIVIIPFQGQGDVSDELSQQAKVLIQEEISEVQPEPKQPEKPVLVKEEAEKMVGVMEEPQRTVNKYAKPTGILKTSNLGIKSVMNPGKGKEIEIEEHFNPKHKENFTFEALKKSWHEYALKVKREERDLLFSVLVNANITLSSDYKIKMEIVNTVQETEMEREKIELLAHLRANLRNDFISFETTMLAQERVTVLDSKGTFDKLAEENAALHKFRKLFNLDIEY